MNSRVLYAILAVQVLFAIALVVIGGRAREERKLDYLERTIRITSGLAAKGDFQKIDAILPERADAQTLRALLGVPVQTATTLNVENAAAKTATPPGEFWIYYFADGTAPAPVNAQAASKLSGLIECYVLHLDETGKLANTPDSHGFARLLHPLK